MLALPALALSFLAVQDAVGDRYRPGEESSWTIEQNGKLLGTTAARYEGEVELPMLVAHRFRGQAHVSVEVPGGVLEQRYTTELWTDAQGHALRFDFRAQVQDVVSRVEGVLADGKATLVVQQAGNRTELTVDAPAECFLLGQQLRVAARARHHARAARGRSDALLPAVLAERDARRAFHDEAHRRGR